MKFDKKYEEKEPNIKENELDKLINSYYSIPDDDLTEDMYYISMIGRIYSWFVTRTQINLDESKLIDIKNNIQFSADGEQKLKKFSELMEKYTTIMNDAENYKDYYYKYLSSLKVKLYYKSKGIPGIKDIYIKLCKQILDDSCKFYIGLDKKILNIRDNFNIINIK